MLVKIPRSALTDAAVLTCILGAVNLLLSPSDPGWLGINPTPYFLLPILIGSRYGFVAGSAAGLAGCGIIACLLAGSGGVLDMTVIKTRLVTFFALPLAGVLSAELTGVMRRTAGGVDKAKSEFAARCKKLELDLELARQSRYELQLQLLFHGAEICSLDLELQRLNTPGADPLLPGLLNLLNRLSELSDAALYRLALDGRVLQREAYIGDASAFPETLARPAAAIAWTAVSTGQLTTCRDPLTDRQLPAQPYIAALPLTVLDGTSTYVLLMHDMPFPAITWQNFARIELICAWVMTTAALQKENPGSPTIANRVSAKQFRRALDLAGATAARHGLTSTLLLFTSAAAPDELLGLVQPHLRSTDIVFFLDRSGAELCVLMPLTGQQRAAELADVIRNQPGAHQQKVSYRALQITRSHDPEELQQFMQRPANA